MKIDLPAGNIAITGQGRLFLVQNVEKSSATDLGNMTILPFNINTKGSVKYEIFYFECLEQYLVVEFTCKTINKY